MKENSMSYKTAKQETERLICEIEEMTITHRAYTAECLRRVLKENEELKRKNEELKVLEDDIQDKRIAYIDETEFEEKYMSKKSLKDKIEKLLNKLTENPDYIAKIGNIEIGLAHKTKNSQTFYIYRDKKERENNNG